MKFKRLFAILTTALILIATSQSFAAMYKYQDEKGNWVYSQRPPADGDFTTIKADKAPRTSNMTSKERNDIISKSRESVIGTPEDKKAKKLTESETAKNEAIRRESCEKSKQALSSLQVYRRFRDKDGNVTRMSDDERAQKIENAKTNISQFCD